MVSTPKSCQLSSGLSGKACRKFRPLLPLKNAEEEGIALWSTMQGELVPGYIESLLDRVDHGALAPACRPSVIYSNS